MSRIGAAIAAGCLTAGFVVGPLFAGAAMDMSAPVPWTGTGAKPFVTRDAKGGIATIGLTIPAAAVKGTPTKRSEAVLPMTGAGMVQSANLQWHPSGHEPEHVYDVPHFDVHFYTITEKTRGGIVPNSPLGEGDAAQGDPPARRHARARLRPRDGDARSPVVGARTQPRRV